MTESFLGIDVGYSQSRRTTGLCLLTLNQDRFQWACRNTGSDDSQRQKDLRELIPCGTRIGGVGIDGPLARNLNQVDRYRSADALLTRGSFQSRCKPGPTNSPTGRQLHFHATELAKMVLKLKNEGYLNIDDASHPHRIHVSRIVEVFPDAFLGVLLRGADFQAIQLGRGKSDRFWELAVRRGLLKSLVLHLAAQTRLGEPIDTIKDHDHRAAFLCALAAMCVTKNKYVAVGDPEDGHIILPPCDVWPLDADSQTSWAKSELQQNMAKVRENKADRPNHHLAQAICNGRRWL